MNENQRLMSLDALRGADMLFIVGLSGAISALCGVVGVDGGWLAQQMFHVDWNGFRHHDTIFPLFLFLSGVTWPFSYAKQVQKGVRTGTVLRKIAKRGCALVLLGLVMVPTFSFDFAHVRCLNVLSHIGCCWAAAALISVFVRGMATRLFICLTLLLGHWAVLFFFRAPDAAVLLSSTDPAIAAKVAFYASSGTEGFSFVGNIAGWIDRMFAPGWLYEANVFDPEGLLGKITGTSLALFGVLAGEWLRRTSVTGNRKTIGLILAGLCSGGLVLGLERWCPINKKLWTSTFVLAATSYSCLVLALFYWIIDVRGWRRWSFALRVVGMNSITIYVMGRFVDFKSMSAFFFSGVAGLGSADWQSFVLDVGRLVCQWLVLLFLYRKNVFLKV